MYEIMKWSEGNPGALEFLMELSRSENAVFSISILPKLNKLPSIRGTNLYILWSDLGNKNMEYVQNLCHNCPSDILEDACSRQDYSGVEMVKAYLN